MVVALEPVVGEELPAWLAHAHEGYVTQRIASGEDAATATQTAERQQRELFGEGDPASGQHVFWILADGQRVGSLWIGTHPERPAGAWWIWSIEIDESTRGQGLGRRAMLLAEARARSLGATELGLNVFGHNTVARALYESLGYEPTAINMRKLL